jgi:hypothetical protein
MHLSTSDDLPKVLMMGRWGDGEMGSGRWEVGGGWWLIKLILINPRIYLQVVLLIY